jgi:hypothetical protein
MYIFGMMRRKETERETWKVLEEKLRKSHRRNFLMKPLRLVTD